MTGGTVLVTGANGFLGTQVCRLLIRDTDMDVVAMARGTGDGSVALKLRRAWVDWPELEAQVGSRVRPLCGDVAKPGLGLPEETTSRLVKDLTHIIHIAADMRLDGPIEELRRTNVGGARHVIELARAVDADHGITRLGHVSTAYVAGSRRGDVPEDALSDEHGFSSRYELSKFEGEQVVREAMGDLPISVFRPGMVVGDSEKGRIKTFNTLYFPLKLYITKRLRVLPARPSLRVNLIPVDYVADAIVRLTLHPEATGLTFHLTAPLEDLPTAREFLDLVRSRARETHGIKLKRALFIPSPVRATKGRYHAQQVITRERTGVFEALITLAPYFNESRRFHRDNVDRLLGRYEMDWRKLTRTIVDYAVSMSFMHWSDRTVQEQILFRLRSKSLPVTLHDVHGGRDHPRDSREVRDQMLAAAAALQSMGVRPGDRVALVGLNSTRYITIDVGIALAGAASVPLYYTSPPAELDQILAASGAKVLLVGIPKLLERLDELTVNVPVVSFCREDPRMEHGKDVMDWGAFLDLGAGFDGPTTAPVAFRDLATVRYTSGTTGQPKGVTFNHENLRWMATSTASLLDWETRTHHIKYLSFLPMNHVVEGILAAYCPYYTPCKLDIYFLEDFRDLQDTLGMVQPTLFFGVPRFYEKVWEALLETNIGQNYLAAGEGLKKRLLRRLIRRGLLKKAGLNEAAQLFVGSAPIGKDLVSAYQDMGIDVLNAFGLTEAPLVTMNIQGRNRAGTVGEPLPETEVRVAEDEEILIRGPQVTPGYLDPSTPSPLQDGWLMTGDLGYMTREGSLVIHGRKKELIVTSYGKNIHPVAIETLLRDIPGVDEAMVVGDGRPFCTALLWAGCDGEDEELMAAMDDAVCKINARLSHPEQLKQWAILRNDLSIECGDLTASLKLKRREVSERFSRVLDALYGEASPPSDGMLHIGSGQRGD